MLNIFNKTQGKAGLVGIYVTAKKFTLAHVIQEDDKPELLLCKEIAAENAGERAKALVKEVKKLELKETKTSYVLAPADYKLLLVEAPSVEPEEMAAAVKWKIKDLIEHPVEEMAITVFPVPDDAYRSGNEMVYVVATRKVKSSGNCRTGVELWT